MEQAGLKCRIIPAKAISGRRLSDLFEEHVWSCAGINPGAVGTRTGPGLVCAHAIPVLSPNRAFV